VKKLNPAAIRRRSLKKFGDALGQNASDNLTVVSTEEIFLERTRPAGAKAEPEKGADLASLGNASLIVCRTCGKKGDHWTSKCPFKDIAATKGFLPGGEKPPTDDEVSGMSAGGAGGKGSYVPPSMRSGSKADGGESMRRGRDDNSIRVTNLSEDTREQDLQELFRPFGAISRIYVAFDRETGLSRGFAFINFVNRYVRFLSIVPPSIFMSCLAKSAHAASLTSKGPRIHGFKMKNSIDHIVKNIIDHVVKHIV
jgi:translation initiation factor 3 subunit G